MSEDKTAVSAKESEKIKKPKKKNKNSFIWIVGVVILILISLTFILPTTMFSSTQSAISFGKYNGTSIELTAESYFYYQLQSIYSYYVENYGESTAAAYSYNIYYSAFQQALINEAFQEMAEKAGFNATNSQISDAVVSSGYYSDGTNSYSKDAYDSATDLQKDQIVAWMKEYVTFQEVQNTILDAPVSSTEADFVRSLSDNKRSVEYIALTETMYPDEDTVAYAKERADLFSTVTYKSLTYTTEEEAQSALSSIAGGMTTMDDEGAVTVETYRYEESDSEKAELLFSSAEGSLLGPVASDSSYVIYYIEKGAAEADYTSSSVLSDIKSYIASNDSDVIKTYLEGIVDTVYADASQDFEGAAEKYGLDVSTVSSVALNTGDSQFIYSFNYTTENSSYTGASTNGYIYTEAQSDTSWAEKLFSVDYNTVLEPVYVNSAYVIARPVESESSSSYTPTLLSTMYSSYAPQYGLVDCETKIVQSDKVENNFISAYISALYGSSTN